MDAAIIPRFHCGSSLRRAPSPSAIAIASIWPVLLTRHIPNLLPAYGVIRLHSRSALHLQIDPGCSGCLNHCSPLLHPNVEREQLLDRRRDLWTIVGQFEGSERVLRLGESSAETNSWLKCEEGAPGDVMAFIYLGLKAGGAIGRVLTVP